MHTRRTRHAHTRAHTRLYTREDRAERTKNIGVKPPYVNSIHIAIRN